MKSMLSGNGTRPDSNCLVHDAVLRNQDAETGTGCEVGTTVLGWSTRSFSRQDDYRCFRAKECPVERLYLVSLGEEDRSLLLAEHL